LKIEREWKSPAAALLPPTNSSIFWHVGTVVELQAKKQIVCFVSFLHLISKRTTGRGGRRIEINRNCVVVEEK
jgi:hypothetical protein